MKGIVPVMLETVGTKKDEATGRWVVTKATIDRMNGQMVHVPIEGEPDHPTEGLADQRARALAVEIGDAKFGEKKRRQVENANIRKRLVRSQRDKEIIARFMNKVE